MMKNTTLLLMLFLVPVAIYAQSMRYDLYGTTTNPNTAHYPVVTLDTLEGAQTIKDIHARYPAHWVNTYHSVQFSTTCSGHAQIAQSLNDTLSKAQIDLLYLTENESSVKVEVDYIPENTLKYNPPRTMSFKLKVVPIFQANFPGGRELLLAYLQENIMDHISEQDFEQIKRASAKFQIDTEGHVVNVQIVETTNHPEIDELLLKAICNMPQWMPAKDINGKNVVQEFEFMMGTRIGGC